MEEGERREQRGRTSMRDLSLRVVLTIETLIISTRPTHKRRLRLIDLHPLRAFLLDVVQSNVLLIPVQASVGLGAHLGVDRQRLARRPWSAGRSGISRGTLRLALALRRGAAVEGVLEDTLGLGRLAGWRRRVARGWSRHGCLMSLS